MPPDFADAARRYLDTPSVGLPPRVTTSAVARALADWSEGAMRFEAWDEAHAACRALAAREVDGSASDVALLPSVVPAVSYVASVLSRRGGVVLAHRREFRSLLLPALAAYGPERVRWADGPYTSQSFRAVLDEGVSAVLVSSVSSHDGARVDLGSLLEAAEAVGAEVVVDATQSAGIVGLGVAVGRPAAVVFAGYKGLLSPRGAAYGVIRPDLVGPPAPFASPYGMADTPEVGSYGPPVSPRPGAPGLDQSPAWFSWVGARASLEFLGGIPLGERERRATVLAGRLRSALAEQGHAVTHGDLPSPVVSLPVTDPGVVLAGLAEAGVRASVRQGTLRLGFHLYVTEEAVAAALEALSSLEPRLVSQRP